MLPQRRIKILLIAVVTSIVLYLYYSSDARKIQNQKFYQSTVSAIEAQRVAKTEKGAAAGHAGHDVKVEGAEEKLEPAIPKDKDTGKDKEQGKGEEMEEISIAGRTKMQVPKKNPDPDHEKSMEVDEGNGEAKAELNSVLKRSPVIIFSKSYCPFSKKAKHILLDKYNIEPAPYVVELDQHALGRDLQDLLGKNTGRRTVPNVLVSGKSIGGGDDIASLHEKDELVTTLKSLGGKWITDVNHKKEE